ncbi:MAG: ABC transporter substrate-binding protein [Actinomycetota bacterium]|nr:ABC transporter substrate-binding protein [Actinomycetota bacterium]
MQGHRNRWGRAALALLLPLVLVGAACAGDDDDSGDASTDTGADGDLAGTTVTIFGPEVEGEAQGFLDSFADFEEETGIDVQYQGDRSFEEQIGVRVDGGDPPDIAMFPQPGKIRDFAEELVPLSDDVAATVTDSFDAGWTDLVTIDGDVYGVPAKADLKSLVWYSPAAFEEAGYEIPTTFEDFIALTDTMMADGKTPMCIGLGSDAATGWPFTDWVEDMMLRLKGPEVYDQWVNHEIPFNDPDVVEVGEYVRELWSQPGFVYGGLQNVAATPFADAGLPLLDGDCMLHRQGNFYAANWPDGTEIGTDGAVNAFYLPGSTEHPNITLSGGIYAAAFSDRPEVEAAMAFLASTDYSDTRAPVGGFLSPNKDADASLYPTEIEQSFAEILTAADPVRFDASDQMPGAVGSGSFWTAAVDITTGAKTVQAAFDAVEASWPG